MSTGPWGRMVPDRRKAFGPSTFRRFLARADALDAVGSEGLRAMLGVDPTPPSPSPAPHSCAARSCACSPPRPARVAPAECGYALRLALRVFALAVARSVASLRR